MRLTQKAAEKMGIAFPETKAKQRPRQYGKGVNTGPKKVKALTGTFEALCKAHGLPEPVAEYPWGKDLKPPRKWRFDWLFEGTVAVEIIGGIWIGGHHNRGQTMIDDMARRNMSQIAGFLQLEFTPQQIESGEAFPVIKLALGLGEAS